MKKHILIQSLAITTLCACQKQTPELDTTEVVQQQPDEEPSTPQDTQDSQDTPTTGAPDLTLVANPDRPEPLNKIKLPSGFEIDYYAKDLPAARSMALSPEGTLYVGTRRDSKVWALRDEDGDNKAEKRYMLTDKLSTPNGVAFKDGDLYVAEISRILKFTDIENNLDNPPEPEVIYNAYPTESHHGWKFIAFGPDDALYVPVGAPCNFCERDNPIYASITRLPLDTLKPEVFAHGVRNTVGFDWHPETKELWFTDNGRDRLGDDIPPDELNKVTQKGQHFGFPYCHGGDIIDPELGEGHSCDDYIAPEQKLGPHVAALGMRFHTGDMFPKEYKNQIFIAEHGSWNRSTPIGYRVTLVQNNGEHASTYDVFAEGWKNDDGSRWGRPVDVLVMSDGALLISDDEHGAIYRVTHD